MKVNLKRTVKYIIFIHLAALALIFTSFMLSGADSSIINSLQPPYRIISAFLFYIQFFLPLSAAGIFFVFLLTDRNSFNPESVNYFLAALINIIIPILAVFSFLTLYLEPSLNEKKVWLSELSETAGFYLKELEKNTGLDPEKEYVFSDLYLYIDPDNEEINNRHDDLKIKLLDNYRETGSAEETAEAAGFSIRSLTGKKLIEISEFFMAKKDYSSAAYYSEMAGIFRNFRKSSERMIKQAEEGLNRSFLTNPERETLFDGKLKAMELLNSEKFIESYYQAVELKKLFPEDNELDTIVTEAMEKMRSISFFYEEIEEFVFVPGKKNIIFTEKNEGGTTIINCGKIVYTDSNIYFFNIGVLFLDRGNRILKSFSAPYGKRIGNSINMNCIGKTEEKYFLPEWTDVKDNQTSIPISYRMEDLINFSGTRYALKKMNTLYLFTNMESLKNAGFGKTGPVIEAGGRIIRCINFLLMICISTYSGLSFMKRGKRKNYMSLLMFPVVFFVAYFSDLLLFTLNINLLENLLITAGEFKSFAVFTLITALEFSVILFLTVRRGIFTD